MPALSKVRSDNAKSASDLPYTPVAVFVGGTAGIGRGMAEALARYTNGRAQIIIVGRNREAAESIIASFPKPTDSQGAEQTMPHQFVECDATLMKQVHATTTKLLADLPKLHYLVLSPGFLSIKGRDETEEGLDKRLALTYYARWKFTNDLMPLLRKAKDAGDDAKVFSVQGPGRGQKLDMDDLGLKNNYTVAKSMTIPSTYNDLMVEEFAIRQPDIAFTHIFPGAVRTNILWPSRWFWIPLGALFWVLLYPFSVSPKVCAEYMLWALFDGKQGFFRRGQNGDEIDRTKYVRTEEERKKLWEHTVEAVKI